jgi:cleavage stimulation factor subunit 2
VYFQGRGGPGMASSVDTQKQLAGTPVVGDTGLHQPVGLPSAIHAASVMAECQSTSCMKSCLS